MQRQRSPSQEGDRDRTALDRQENTYQTTDATVRAGTVFELGCHLRRQGLILMTWE